MTLLTNELLTELLTARPAPCLSVYQHTHRQHPDNTYKASEVKRA